MPFSEDDLRNALRRKDPGPGFTQRVMARVSQSQDAAADGRREQPKRWWWLSWTWKLRPALGGSVVAIALLLASGLGYWRHERILEARKLQEQQAEAAREQMMLALRITNTKLNHVLERVSESIHEPPQPKIRRQSL